MAINKDFKAFMDDQYRIMTADSVALKQKKKKKKKKKKKNMTTVEREEFNLKLLLKQLSPSYIEKVFPDGGPMELFQPKWVVDGIVKLFEGFKAPHDCVVRSALRAIKRLEDTARM